MDEISERQVFAESKAVCYPSRVVSKRNAFARLDELESSDVERL